MCGCDLDDTNAVRSAASDGVASPIPIASDIALRRYEIVCLRGVEYYRTYNVLTEAFKPDGTLYTCGGAE